jgi:hypothetical protein
VDLYFSQKSKIERVSAAHLTGMGDAVVALVCSLFIFAIAFGLFWYQRQLPGKSV